jgi:hypothetical protein
MRHLFVAAFVLFSSAPALAEDSDDDAEKGPGLLGLGVAAQASLLGPRSLFALEAAYQPLKYVQAGLGFGFSNSSADDSLGDVRAHAEETSLSFYAIARGFVFERHSPYVELGLGVTSAEVVAESSGGDLQLAYSYSGTPVLAFAGLGYAYRARFGLQVNVGGGYSTFLANKGTSKVTTVGNFDGADLEGFQRAEDDIILRPRLYLRAGVGFIF